MPISLIYRILSLRERELGVGTSASGPRWGAVNCSCSRPLWRGLGVSQPYLGVMYAC